MEYGVKNLATWKWKVARSRGGKVCQDLPRFKNILSCTALECPSRALFNKSPPRMERDIEKLSNTYQSEVERL